MSQKKIRYGFRKCGTHMCLQMYGRHYLNHLSRFAWICAHFRLHWHDSPFITSAVLWKIMTYVRGLFVFVRFSLSPSLLFQTCFSYTRCSVKSRIRTLRRTAPSQTEVIGLNCSDHSTNCFPAWMRVWYWTLFVVNVVYEWSNFLVLKGNILCTLKWTFAF